MSDVTEIKSVEEFDAFIADGTSVVVFTSPSWCPPCKQLEPKIHMAASQSEIPFATLDPDVLPEVSSEFKIMSIPQVFVFRNGEHASVVEGRTVPKILAEI